MRAAVLWLYGADAVGKSAVGWEAYTQLADIGEPVATSTRTTWASARRRLPIRPSWSRGTWRVWAGFAAAGARLLVVSGIVVTAEDRDRFERAIPEAGFTFCRLTAGGHRSGRGSCCAARWRSAAGW